MEGLATSVRGIFPHQFVGEAYEALVSEARFSERQVSRDFTLHACVLTSDNGTFETSRMRRAMSEFEGKAENIDSHCVLLSLTPSGQPIRLTPIKPLEVATQ